MSGQFVYPTGAGRPDVRLGEPYHCPMTSSAGAVDHELSAVGAAAGARLLELTREIWRLLTDDIVELRGDSIVENMLEASVEENVATLLHV